MAMKLGALINSTVLGLMGLGLSLGSFFVLFDGSSLEAAEWSFENGAQFEETLEAKEQMMVQRNGRDAVLLFPGAKATLSWNESQSHLSVDLEEGAVLFVAEAGDMKVSVENEFLRIDSENSTGYLEFEDEGVEFFALNHASRVNFLEEGETLNSILVPGEHRTKVHASKVSDTIGKLRLTKLTKEFPMYSIQEDDLSELVQAAHAEVENIYVQSAAEFLAEIQSGQNYGPPLGGYEAYAYAWFDEFRRLLTFIPEAEQRRIAERESQLLSFVATNLLAGRSEAEYWLEAWSQSESDEYGLKQLYVSMHAVLPGDDLYPIKEQVAQALYQDEQQLVSLRRKYQEIETLIARGAMLEAEEAYEEYQADFESALIGGAFADESILHDLSLEYSLLERLLRSNGVFYTPENLLALKELETQILELAGTEVDEERQAFVQSKIRFLTKLFDLVQSRQVSVDAASELAGVLLADAQSHLAAVRTKVAVTAFFESELEKYELAKQYINAPEFYSYNDFHEGLAAYTAKSNDLRELNSYIQELRSGDLEELAVDVVAVQDEVERLLLRNGIQYAQVKPVGDSDYRLFEVVGGRTAGHSFEAKFDRQSQLFYDVVVSDVRFSTGLLLENLRSVIEEVVGEAVPEEEIEEEEEIVEEPVVEEGVSLTESVAIENASKAFVEAGLEDFEFTIKNLESNQFYFNGKIGKFGIPVAGVFDAKDAKISEVKWLLNEEEMTLPDVKLAAFEKVLVATYDQLTKTEDE